MSSTDVVVGLDLRVDEQLPIADLIRRAVQARAIVSFAKDLEAHAKDQLEAAARADVETAGGGGFSRTVEGVRATLSDPQPKPYVADEGEFVTWLLEHTDLDVQVVERVEVIDHAGLAQTIRSILDQKPSVNTDDPDGCVELTGQDAEDLAQTLVESTRVTAEYRLPEKVLDTLVESGRCVATDGGLVDPKTGETVPGVGCQRAKATLSVTPSKQAKARDRAIVASFFGLPAELPGGGA